MILYQERLFAYVLAGVIAVTLGVVPDAFITEIVQPAVGLWISSSAVMIGWATLTKSFRDPMNSLLGIPLKMAIPGLVSIGALLIVYAFIRGSIDAGTVGVLFLLFAVDAFLSARESIRRSGTSCGVNEKKP